MKENALIVLRSTVAFLASLIILTIGILIAIPSPTLGQCVLKFWAWSMLKIFSITVTIRDENNGQYPHHGLLYVTLNQTSLTEAFIGTYAFPTPYRAIMSAQFALFPFLGWASVALRGVVLIQQWPAQAKRAMNKATQANQKEANFWMSVEGMRSRDGKLSPFKKGAAVYAIGAGISIVPIYFKNVRERMPYGDWKIRPGHVEVTLCKIVPTSGLTYDDRNRLTDQLKAVALEKASTQAP